MARRKLTIGEKGWAGLATYVLLVDSIAWLNNEETMSCSFGRWLQKPRSRLVTGASWGIVTFHLFWSLPLPGQAFLKRKVVSWGVRRNGTKLVN